MDRWARGDELACSGRKGAVAGGCRNLAVWLIRSDLERTRDTRRTYMSCNLHLQSHIRLLTERHHVYSPEVEPFQSPDEAPLTKRKQIHVDA